MQKLRMHDKLPLRRGQIMQQSDQQVLRAGMHRRDFMRFCRGLRGRQMHLRREQLLASRMPNQHALRLARGTQYVQKQQMPKCGLHGKQPLPEQRERSLRSLRKPELQILRMLNDKSLREVRWSASLLRLQMRGSRLSSKCGLHWSAHLRETTMRQGRMRLKHRLRKGTNLRRQPLRRLTSS